MHWIYFTSVMPSKGFENLILQFPFLKTYWRLQNLEYKFLFLPHNAKMTGKFVCVVNKDICLHHLFEDGTKMKIPSHILLPLRRPINVKTWKLTYFRDGGPPLNPIPTGGGGQSMPTILQHSSNNKGHQEVFPRSPIHSLRVCAALW